MVKKIIRPGLIISLVGFAILIAGLSLKTDATAARGDKIINIESFSWGLSQSQFLRICMVSGGSASSRIIREEVSFIYVGIKFETGDVVLERLLTVPPGQFGCTDFSHSELVAAGLVPEPNTRLQFLVTLGLNESLTLGAAQEVTVGAAQEVTVGAAQEVTGSAETITVAGGRTETYKTIQTRQITVVQDL